MLWIAIKYACASNPHLFCTHLYLSIYLSVLFMEIHKTLQTAADRYGTYFYPRENCKHSPGKLEYAST